MLALTAFVLVAMTMLLSSLFTGIASFTMTDYLYAQFGGAGFEVLSWAQTLFPPLIYGVALILGLVATRRNRPTRWRGLGFIAVGAAGFAILTEVLSRLGWVFVGTFY